MNVFNRIIVVLLLLSLIVLSIVSVVNVFAHLFKWSDVANRILNSTSNVNVYVAALLLILLLVISILLVIFEFYRRKIKHANISADQTGKVMVILSTAAQQIKESLNNVQDIISPIVKVIPKNDGIIINIFSKLSTGINVVEKTKEIRETASNFASRNLGFKVLQTNYTGTGFITKKVKEVKPAKEEIPKEVKQEENTDNKTGY